MKVKLQSSETGSLLDAVMKLCQLPPKEASNFIREHAVRKSTCTQIRVDVDMPRERIETIISYIPDIEVQFLDEEQINDNDADTAAPESANERVVEQKLQKTKSQEVTDDDLGVSIHSIDETSIGWQLKALFSYKQATRVMAGLHDAKFNVTETNVVYEDMKAKMLVVTKTFPTGTRKKDLENFEKLLHAFICSVCEMVDLEEKRESAKELAIKSFNELQDYE